ncbi:MULTISPECIES: NAD-dependent DNA ligase LigA [Oceanotoga]|jgi:DNA ligase (NAD+)|uniref:NAD-dependent DNA ligase LigA n=1 Tax=Oceanotoga TaxID=1255275 RepID=UPI002653CE3C|nr:MULTISPECIES: NAD-dependent DNA ligase LigA [Oceanotoga]MDN5341837.1 ligase [Oceanotoga sp.]MDO7976682.1 NAD-dependent DNA ligase LigA [Oceanotoga teriensis]
MNKKEKYEELKNKINYHNNKYYIENDPEITDEEYDKIFSELLKIEKENPEYKTLDSPSQRVGGLKNENFEKIQHTIPMLSLDNTYNSEEIIDFDRRIQKNLNEQYEYICELKIDGVSISLKYENGILIRALTRGNGSIGEDITQNVKTIMSIPLKLKENINIEVRGEIFMKNLEFEKINKFRESRGLNIFANPRNATAGTLKLLDTSEVAKRKMDSYIYYIVNKEELDIKNQESALKKLEELGFKVNENNKKALNIQQVIEYWELWNKNRKKLEYEADGIVVKINNFDQQRNLGETVRSPRWAIAFKFQAETKTTKINEIKLQVGSTGIITPVAELEPIKLEGTIVKRCSLHNFEYIKLKDIKEKDTVVIQKAGGIIPQIVNVVKEKRTGKEIKVEEPLRCPVCNSETGKLNPSEVAIRCLNPLCPEKLARSLEKFVSREAMNIEGLGPKLIKRMVEAKIIKDISDIYYIKDTDLFSLGEGIGEKTVENLLKEIEKSKNQSLEYVLNGLGIPLVGKKTAKDLSKYFKNIDNIKNSNTDKLKEVDGIGEDIAKSLKIFFEEEITQKILNKLKNAGINFEYKNGQEDGILINTIISQTGTLKNMSRKEFSDYIEKKGGIFSSSVTKKVDILVIGENPGSKLEKARKYQIPVMEEDEFFNKY